MSREVDTDDSEYKTSEDDNIPVYIDAPESVTGSRVYSLATDVYMFGGLLWEMWTRSAPFSWWPNPTTLLRMRREQKLDMADEVHTRWHGSCLYKADSEVSVAIKMLMIECLQYERKKRPRMQQVVEKLEEILKQHQERSDSSLALSAPAPAASDPAPSTSSETNLPPPPLIPVAQPYLDGSPAPAASASAHQPQSAESSSNKQPKTRSLTSPADSGDNKADITADFHDLAAFLVSVKCEKYLPLLEKEDVMLEQLPLTSQRQLLSYGIPRGAADRMLAGLVKYKQASSQRWAWWTKFWQK